MAIFNSYVCLPEGTPKLNLGNKNWPPWERCFNKGQGINGCGWHDWHPDDQVARLSSQFLGALMNISICNMSCWEWQISKTVYIKSHRFVRKLWQTNYTYTRKYDSLICFQSGNSILVGSCRFQMQFQDPYTLGNWNDEWWSARSIDFFPGVTHQHRECRGWSSTNINIVRVEGKLRHWRPG